MLALFGNLSPSEILLALVIAVLVFGRRLPEVAARTAIQLGKLRRSLTTMWRETGLSEEWRAVQREVHGVASFDPRRAAREMSRDAAGRLLPPKVAPEPKGKTGEPAGGGPAPQAGSPAPQAESAAPQAGAGEPEGTAGEPGPPGTGAGRTPEP